MVQIVQLSVLANQDVKSRLQGVDEEREQDAVSFADMDVGKGREQDAVLSGNLKEPH